MAAPERNSVTLPERPDALVQGDPGVVLHLLHALVEVLEGGLPIGQVARREDVVVHRNDVIDETINL